MFFVVVVALVVIHSLLFILYNYNYPVYLYLLLLFIVYNYNYPVYLYLLLLFIVCNYNYPVYLLSIFVGAVVAKWLTITRCCLSYTTLIIECVY